MTESSFVMIKPDGVQRKLIGRIISRLEAKGLTILDIEMKWKHFEFVQKLYSHVPKDILLTLSSFMANAPLVGIMVEGESACEIVKTMVGATDSREANPGTIRGDFGKFPIHLNVVHCSDDRDSARRESALFWEKATDRF